jgi:hypothetical protein
MEVPKGTLSRLRGGLHRFKRLLERIDGARPHPQELSAQLYDGARGGHRVTRHCVQVELQL